VRLALLFIQASVLFCLFCSFLVLGSIGFEYPGLLSLNETCHAGFVKTPGAPTTLGNMIFWISKETTTLLESPTFSVEMNLNKYWS
jgi:hypothetical protein